MAGLRRGFCSYPHKQVKFTKNIPEKNLVDRGDGVKEYVNLNPYVPDDNDPNPDQNDPDWDIIKGYCLRNYFHKTCASQPIFFWCSQKYMNLLIAYEEIVNRYCSNLGIKRTCNSPLFNEIKIEKFFGFLMFKYKEMDACVGNIAGLN